MKFLVGFLLAVFATTNTITAAEPVGRVLFLIGEAEYDTDVTLPEFARSELQPAGYHCDFVFAKSNDRQSADVHAFPGLRAALAKADVLFVSVRRRLPLAADMAALREWVAAGKPVIGIRTSSHAFAGKDAAGYRKLPGHADWPSFDRDVFGVNYQNHYGNKPGEDDKPTTLVRVARESANHPCLLGIQLPAGTAVESHLYKSRNLDPQATLLLQASIAGQPETLNPVAWTLTRNGAKVFYTSLGGPGEMKLPWFRRLLKNAVAWSLIKPPKVGAGPAWNPRSKETESPAQTPAESYATLSHPDDLSVDLLLAEPVMAQPAFLNFDERGRLWVVQYRQYPEPAGLRIVSRDHFWRNQYDKVPPPPGAPDYVAGQTRITIHEDTDGDGTFDSTKTFLDNLSLATSCARGHGGVYVLAPPYLLFYPDEDGDDVPDRQPEVHLEGFGIEDSHSVAAALCWGPDGWLYGSHGSTVTSAVKVTGSGGEPTRSVGQMMWRYHPVQRRYEVFAEGGGNIWSCEFDAQGRLFAGSNGGSPGFFYLPGAYYSKNFRKHGDLSNPYAFGYLDAIDHPGYQRVSCSLIVYEGAALPDRYDGAIVAANPVQGVTVASTRQRDGLRYRGQYIDLLTSNEDRWCRPVYPEFGPDGAIYVGDWYDQQVNHFRNHEGRISKTDGRIYRIRSRDAAPLPPFDLRQATPDELVDMLEYRNRWWRETARRVLAEHPNRRTIVPRLRSLLHEKGQTALESLWCLHLCDALDAAVLDTCLEHANPHVRQWAIRLTGDRQELSTMQLSALEQCARAETDLEVCGQLAATARRLNNRAGLNMLGALLSRDNVPQDRALQWLCWWGIEVHSQQRPSEVVALFSNKAFVQNPFVARDIAAFVMQRLASEGSTQQLSLCARLLASTTDESLRSRMIAGFEQAFRGRAMVGIPHDLIEQLSKSARTPLSLRLRLDQASALPEATRLLSSKSGSRDEKIRVLEVLGEQPHPAALSAILFQIREGEEAVRLSALHAAGAYADDVIGREVVDQFLKFNDVQREAARGVLTSRTKWCHAWLDAVDAGRLQPDLIPGDAVAAMRRHADPVLTQRLDKRFGVPTPTERAVWDAEILRVKNLVETTFGDPKRGEALFAKHCAACHKLFHSGGDLGPDLTAYQRNKLDSLLLAIVHPSAEIREGFETIVVLTADGRVLSGFVEQRNEDVITFRPVGGGALVLQREQIEEILPSKQSLMPNGLLEKLSDAEIRDLFTYLRSSQPIP